MSDRPDPVSRVYLDVDEPLSLSRAAAELGVDATTLSNHLAELTPAFAALATPSGASERTAFDAAFVEALCLLEPDRRNRPASCP